MSTIEKWRSGQKPTPTITKMTESAAKRMNAAAQIRRRLSLRMRRPQTITAPSTPKAASKRPSIHSRSKP